MQASREREQCLATMLARKRKWLLPLTHPSPLRSSGSWSTCTNGCHEEPPRDVAHVQFRSRIAFKLVWCPPDYRTFVLVDDAGSLLNRGTPMGTLPAVAYRQGNYQLVRGSKYAIEAENNAVDKSSATE